jgi:hypothetical protein
MIVRLEPALLFVEKVLFSPPLRPSSLRRGKIILYTHPLRPKKFCSMKALNYLKYW